MSLKQKLFDKPGLWVFLFSFFLCVLVMGGHLYTPDEEVLYRSAASFAHFEGGAIEPLGGMQTVLDEQGQLVQKFEPGFASRVGKDGRQYAQYGVGLPLATVPLVWLGEGLHLLLPQEALNAIQLPTVMIAKKTLYGDAIS